MTEETSQPIDSRVQPELKQVLGALVFAARKPIATDELLGVLTQVDQSGEDTGHLFGKIQESDIRAALEQLRTEYAERNQGLILVEVAGGFRFQTDPAGGPWVRKLLNLEKPARLSKPALETLAIIAYRQPATRAEIEALRGVNVDAMMRHLLELQLIRIVGRSELPGRPLMYGTTQLFLEHFGLSSVKNLPGVEQLSRRDAEHAKREASVAAAAKTEDGTTELPLEEKAAAKENGKTEDGNKEDQANIQHPTSNIEHPMDEQKIDDPQRKAEGEEAAETEVADCGAAAEKEEETEDEDEEDEDDEDDEDEEDEDEDDDDDAEGKE